MTDGQAATVIVVLLALLGTALLSAFARIFEGIVLMLRQPPMTAYDRELERRGWFKRG